MRVETERLVVDPLQASDKEDYFTNISHDETVLETFVCRYAETLDDFDFAPYLTRDDIFAIRHKTTGKLIGIFVECEKDEANHVLEIGYGIGRAYWNQGYMTEAVNAALQYYFDKTDYRTVYASFFPENVASKRVMEKCGMTFSHIQEKEFTYLGRERDLIYYKITVSQT